MPLGYSAHSDEGEIYYFHEESKTSMWEHPLDTHYKALVIAQREQNNIITAPIAESAYIAKGHSAATVLATVAESAYIATGYCAATVLAPL